MDGSLLEESFKQMYSTAGYKHFFLVIETLSDFVNFIEYGHEAKPSILGLHIVLLAARRDYDDDDDYYGAHQEL